MKVIDLLNKIANGDRPNFRFRDNDYIYDEHDGNYRPSFLGIWKIYAILNDEVEILEEEKKIPEKLNISNFPKHNNSLKKTAITLNQVIDYLKSKGE